MYVFGLIILLLTLVTFIANSSILGWGLEGLKNKRALLGDSTTSSTSKSIMAIFGPVSFYGLLYFLGTRPINNRFAGKLANRAEITIKKYLSNK